jgi:hypothetical protein
MKKYLIISTVGDKSLHHEWIKDNPNFDLVLIYYGNNPNIAQEYINQTPHVYSAKGEKYHLIKSFIQDDIEFISKYDYIWLPDDDVDISSENINRLFNMAKEYNLSISQPSMEGYISHEITKPIPNSLLRYTNFVEVLAPLFNKETLLKVYNTFDLNYSSWGYDYLWPYLLNYPQNSIAIIDDIIMTHTRPVGQNYSRFPKLPWNEMEELLYLHNITNYKPITLKQIFKENEYIF